MSIDFAQYGGGLTLSGPSVRPERQSIAIRIAILGAFALLAGLVVWPLLMLAYASLRSGSPIAASHWTWAGIDALPGQLTSGGIIWSTILIAVVPTFLGVSISIVLAWLQTRTDSPLRRAIPFLIVVSTAISILFYAFGFQFLGDPFTGVINDLWQNITGSRGHLVNTNSWLGILLVETIVTSSHVYLWMIGPLSTFDRTLEEASLVGGASRWRTQIRVMLPLILPVISSVILLGLMAGLQSFETVLVFGSRSNINVLGYQIFNLVNRSSPPQYPQAAAIGLFLTVVLIAFIYIQYRLLRNGDFRTVTGKSFKSEPITLGRRRWAGAAFIAVYGLIAIVLPFAGIFVTSLEPFPGTLSHLTLKAYSELFANSALVQAIETTLIMAAVVGLASTAAGFYVVYIARFTTRRTSVILRGLTLLPAAMPGVAGALATLWAYVSIPGFKGLFGSIWLMIIAIVVQNLIVTVQIAQGALLQLSPELEEAARVGGASRLRVVRTVVLPLMRTSLVAAGLLSAVLTVGNTTTPLLLAGPSTQTVTTTMLNMVTNNYQANVAAALLVFWIGLLVCGTALVVVARSVMARRRRSAVASPPGEPGLPTPQFVPAAS